MVFTHENSMVESITQISGVDIISWNGNSKSCCKGVVWYEVVTFLMECK